jgi:hypothetical protein
VSRPLDTPLYMLRTDGLMIGGSKLTSLGVVTENVYIERGDVDIFSQSEKGTMNRASPLRPGPVGSGDVNACAVFVMFRA